MVIEVSTDTDASIAASGLRFAQPRSRLDLRLGHRAGRAIQEEHTYGREWRRI